VSEQRHLGKCGGKYVKSEKRRGAEEKRKYKMKSEKENARGSGGEKNSDIRRK